MTRVAIYARYSSDLQSPVSVADQIRVARERAKREGWTVVECYADEEISGDTIVLRPGIQRLIQDGLAEKFDILLAEAMDRISRDQADIAAIYKRMQFAGIKMITLSEGELTSLHIGMKGTMNAIFLKDLADKTRRGLSGRVEQGKSGGGIAYGYDVVKKFDADGDPIRGYRTINEEQTKIVRRIFTEYTAGKSPLAIAKQLNKEGIAGPSNSGWSQSTINGNRDRGTGILNNELYIGMLVWNRLRYVKNPDNGKRVSRLNPEDQWLRKEVPELRIIDQTLWDKVKERQSGLQHQMRLIDKRRPKSLFSGLLKCACCGGGFTKTGLHHYGCFKAHTKDMCENFQTIRQDKVEQTVLNALEKHLLDPELCEEFCKEYARHINRLRIAHNAQKVGYEAELKRRMREADRLIQLVVDGVASTAMYKDKINENLFRIEELKTLLIDKQEMPVLLHPNMGLHYRKEVQALITALNSNDCRQEAVEVIRSLIEKITLTPKLGGGLIIDLHGDLAGILTIASGKKGAAVREMVEQVQSLTEPQETEDNFNQQGSLVAGTRGQQCLLSQELLVAGAGFEPAAFRL